MTGNPGWAGFLASRTPALSQQERSPFSGQCVLITGAGGYLGSALAVALHRAGAGRLLLLDQAEYGLYRLEQRLSAIPAASEAIPVLGSVGDAALLRELFARHTPRFVFHAAALKHVPLVEGNALAAAETNVLGTQALLNAAAAHGVQRLVLLSTDKAVAPISVMGATKRVAEQLVFAAQGGAPGFCVARLCNVLGSTGSVAPLFARQIARGKAVTVTHAEASRFFLTRADAVRLLLRTAVHPSPTGLVVPAVDGAQRVLELAKFMLREAVDDAAQQRIVFTGLRVADKLQEAITAPPEAVLAQAPFPGGRAVCSPWDGGGLEKALAGVEAAVSSRNRDLLLQAIACAVPDFPRMHAGREASHP